MPHARIQIYADEEIGEGAAIAFTVCSGSFDGLAECGVNDTIFFNNNVARKGGAVVIGSGPPTSYVEFQRCTVDNSTTGKLIEDDPQGEGGAFAVGQGSTVVLKDSLLVNNVCGKKVCISGTRTPRLNTTTCTNNGNAVLLQTQAAPHK